MFGVNAQCCSVPDDDIASQHQPHMLPSPKVAASRAPMRSPRATFAPHLLRTTTSGALHNTNVALAHLVRSFDDLLIAATETAPSFVRANPDCAFLKIPTRQRAHCLRHSSFAQPTSSIACRSLRLVLIIHSTHFSSFLYRNYGRRRRARLPPIARAGV